MVSLWYGVFCLALVFIATPANLLVICVYGKRRLKTSTEILIIARAVIDVCISLTSFPIVCLLVISVGRGRPTGTCYVTWAFNVLLVCFILGSCTVQVMLACTRFLEVRFPHRRIITPRRAGLISTAACVVSVFSAILVIALGVFRRVPPPDGIELASRCMLLIRSPFKEYIMLMCVTIFLSIFPIAGFYMAVYASIRRERLVNDVARPPSTHTANRNVPAGAVFTVSRHPFDNRCARYSTSIERRASHEPCIRQGREAFVGSPPSVAIINNKDVHHDGRRSYPLRTSSRMPTSSRKYEISAPSHQRVTGEHAPRRTTRAAVGLGFKTRLRRLQIRATHMMLASTVTSLLWWIFAALYIVCRGYDICVFAQKADGTDRVGTLKTIPVTSCVTPIVYIIVNKRFRRECRKLLRL